MVQNNRFRIGFKMTRKALLPIALVSFLILLTILSRNNHLNSRSSMPIDIDPVSFEHMMEADDMGHPTPVVVPKNQRMPLKKIRYATFGTSIAWGAELEKRERDAFIWQLSPTATNLAMRSQGPSYPARCLNSVIGEDIFDVIVLEFTMRQEKSMYLLARRLREHFPDAIIIILRNWAPIMLRQRSTNLGLKFYAQENGIKGKDWVHNPEFQEMFKQSDPTDWNWVWQDTIEMDEGVARESGAIISPMYFNDQDPFDILSVEHFFGPDSFHLSVEGHKDVAERVLGIVKEYGVPSNPRVNNYYHKDVCQSWLESGEIEDGMTIGPTGSIENMPNTEKYALSFEGGEGTITVTNPSNAPQELHVSHYTTGPPPSLYPKTVAILEDANNEKLEIELDPNASKTWGGKEVHLPKEAYLGFIKPGETTITFKSQEETERPFRLTAYIITHK